MGKIDRKKRSTMTIKFWLNGKLIEDGSHQELMEKDGYYAKMYRAQAKWYQ